MIKFRFDAEAAVDAVTKKENAITGALETGAQQAVKIVESAAKRKIKLSRQTNVQDTPKRRRISQRSPLRTLVRGSTGYVELRSHQTGARTKPLAGLYKRFGLERQLTRKGLWVAPARSRLRSKSGYKDRAGLRFFTFAATPGLKAWAEDPSKGLHIKRNTVRLSDPRVRLEITLRPAVEQTLGQVAKTYDLRIRRALQDA